MIISILLFGILLSALLAIRAARLLSAILWLMALSVLLSLTFYSLGAPELAVIELSIGAGLVAIFYVFTINVAGDDSFTGRPLIPWWLVSVMILGAFLLIAVLILPVAKVLPSTSTEDIAETAFSGVLWDLRALDTLLQLPLLFAGVLTVLGLLSERDRDRESDREASKTSLPGVSGLPGDSSPLFISNGQSRGSEGSERSKLETAEARGR